MPPKRPPSLVNPRLVSAVAHPTRLRAMRIFGERVATPREVATTIGEPLNNVAYHVKILRQLNCIELIETRQAHGGRVAEHFYRATRRYEMWDTSAWEELSESEKLGASSAILQQMADDIAEAMASGTLYQDDDRHVSRMPMVLDNAGWDEVISLLAGTLFELMAIQERADDRGREGAEQPHFTKVNIIHFRSPPPTTG